MKIFKEEQRFTQSWLLIILGFSLLVPIYIIIEEFYSENSEMSNNEFIFKIALVFISISLIFIFKLITRIDENGIHYQFFPFHLKPKTIDWSELKFAKTRTYDAISEYGGWGLKGGFFWRKSKGVAYNVSGDIGIQLEYKTGKKILIGTQLLNDVNSVLKTYEEKINTNES